MDINSLLSGMILQADVVHFQEMDVTIETDSLHAIRSVPWRNTSKWLVHLRSGWGVLGVPGGWGPHFGYVVNLPMVIVVVP